MSYFEQLRMAAIERRDMALAAARLEYQQSLAKIKQLERTFGAKRPKSTQRPMSALICQCLPRDRTFTIDELLGLLELAEPGRMFNPSSVRTYFHILERQGAVRRVRREGSRFILWAVKSYQTPTTRYGAMNMRQVCESLLREKGPLMVAELIVTMQSRGYRADADRRS